eukprot:1379478-Pyramimonas_sp.AAC.1
MSPAARGQGTPAPSQGTPALSQGTPAPSQEEGFAPLAPDPYAGRRYIRRHGGRTWGTAVH